MSLSTNTDNKAIVDSRLRPGTKFTVIVYDHSMKLWNNCETLIPAPAVTVLSRNQRMSPLREIIDVISKTGST